MTDTPHDLTNWQFNWIPYEPPTTDMDTSDWHSIEVTIPIGSFHFNIYIPGEGDPPCST